MTDFEFLFMGLGAIQSDSIAVGDILAIHCHDLRTQIENRKFFYKSATCMNE